MIPKTKKKKRKKKEKKFVQVKIMAEAAPRTPKKGA